jgi:predicted metal-dependent hydrolase
MGVQMKALKLSSARTRWGSASVDGTIRLQWKLMHFSPAVIDYVVVHELAHLREMNHSPRFWQVVAEALPDYEVPLEQLRHAVIPE